MKTKEELNAFKKKSETAGEMIAELGEVELEKIYGAGDSTEDPTEPPLWEFKLKEKLPSPFDPHIPEIEQ